MRGERWEDMPDVVEAAARAFEWDLDAYVPVSRREALDDAAKALSAAVSVVPVVPVRVLRDWIEQERSDRDDPSRHPSKRSDRDLTLDALSRVLDDYEKENPK